MLLHLVISGFIVRLIQFVIAMGLHKHSLHWPLVNTLAFLVVPKHLGKTGLFFLQKSDKYEAIKVGQYIMATT